MKRTLLMLTVLLVILILALWGVLPTWPYSHAWGYYPSGGLGILLNYRDHLDAVMRPAA